MVYQARPLAGSGRETLPLEPVPDAAQPAFVARLGWSTPIAASNRMLETVSLATACFVDFNLAPRQQSAAELQVLLFYVDCEVFSTIGRPVTDLAWTRNLSSTAHIDFSLGHHEMRWLSRWVRHQE